MVSEGLDTEFFFSSSSDIDQGTHYLTQGVGKCVQTKKYGELHLMMGGDLLDVQKK